MSLRIAASGRLDPKPDRAGRPGQPGPGRRRSICPPVH